MRGAYIDCDLSKDARVFWRFGKLKMALILKALVLAIFVGRPMQAASLVTGESINRQKSMTQTFKLKNQIPVIIRKSDDSELFQILVQYGRGLKDIPTGRKSLNDFVFSTLPMATKNFPKAEVFRLTSKYDLDISCVGGIEFSYCSLGTVNDAVSESLPLFASMIKEPSFNDEDVALIKERLIARLKSTPSDPNSYVNDVVNSVFYPKGYPYRLNYDEALAELPQFGRKDLNDTYLDFLNASQMAIVVVTSLPTPQIMAEMEKHFGVIGAKTTKNAPLSPPVFDPNNAYQFEDRDVPTAFIRMKFNAPNVLDPDAYASQLFYEIFSKELAEEIRTKRSLSYAVHAMTIQYSAGIGILNVSTSKPQETFEAIDFVIKNMKSQKLTPPELEEYRNIFATSYYLTQETHASMALSLARSHHYFGDALRSYELPLRLSEVKPEDMSRLAKSLLVNPRIGVIFNKKLFKDAWATDFIKKHRLR